MSSAFTRKKTIVWLWGNKTIKNTHVGSKGDWKEGDSGSFNGHFAGFKTVDAFLVAGCLVCEKKEKK